MSTGVVPPPSASDAVDPAGGDPVGRFRRDLIAALGREPAAGERIALAVSGGADSMAMLWLATRSLAGRVIAATVDHGLRSGSADEAVMVADWCAGAGVEHATLRIDMAPPSSGNLHAWARQRRYALLTPWAAANGASGLCTAHHADDQAETFLMRASRGTGIAGLAAVRRRRDGGIATDQGDEVNTAVSTMPLLRPLLGWRRSVLRAVCAAKRVPFVDDPSNADPRFERARFRAWLTDAPWLDVANIARAADHLAEVDADLTALSRLLWRERAVTGAAGVTLNVADLPREMRRRLVRLALAHVDRAAGGAESAAGLNVERLLDTLGAGEKGMLGDVLASARGDEWHFRPAPPRRSH